MLRKKQKYGISQRAGAVLLTLMMLLTSVSIPMDVNATVTNTTVANDYLKYITGLSDTSYNVNGYYNNEWIQITYADAGYLSQIKVDDGAAVSLNGLTSGESTNVNGLQVTQTLSFANAGRFVKVAYTVCNSGTESKSFSLGSAADVQIANNDAATIQTTSTGLRMADSTGTGAQYNLVARNSYGVTDVDSLWFGPYWDTTLYTDYTFTDVDSPSNIEATTGSFAGFYTTDPTTGKKTAFSNVDSAICFAWNNRAIAAGATQTYSVLLGVGGDAQPPQVDVNNDINLNLTNASRGSNVSVSANITDSAGRTDYLFYALDDGDANLLNTVSGTGAVNTVTSEFTIPETWEDDSLHTIYLWVMNDQGAMSDTKAVPVYINSANSNILQEATQYTVSYDSGGAAGTGPSSVQKYEKSKMVLPSNPYTVPSGKTFGGWSDGSSVYLPGEEYTMPSANVTLTAVWLESGYANYCIDYYQKNLDGSKYIKVETAVKTALENTAVTLADPDIKSYTGFTENTASRVSNGTVSSSSTLHLQLYYDRNDVSVTFKNGDTTVSTATIKYGQTVTFPSNPTKAYSTFAGWYDSADGTGTKILSTSAIRPTDGSTMNIYAVWTPDPISLTKSAYSFTYKQAISGQSLSTTGGSGNCSYAITEGTLPSGITLNSDGSFSGTPTAAGSATVKVTATDNVSGAVKVVDVTLNVAKAILTITDAANTTKQYDGTTGISTAALGTISFTGKLGSDEVSVVTTGGTYNSKNVSEADSITLEGLSLTGSSSANYTLDSDQAVIAGTIEKKQITLKVADTAKKVGTDLPAFTMEEVIASGTESALASGETIADIGTFNITTSADAQSLANTYAVTATANTASENYNITLQSGTLTVTQDAPEKDVNYTVTGTSGENSWYTGAVTITPVTATGFDKIWNGTTWVDSVTLLNQELTCIQLKNSTTGEITSMLSGVSYKSDALAPTITYLSGNPDSWVTQQQKIYFTVTDAQSTVDDGTLTVKKGGVELPCTFVETISGGKEYYFMTDGNGTYTIHVADKAGNASNSDVNVSYIETEAPSGISVTGTAAGWTNSDVTLHVTANDTVSGIRGFSYSLDGGSTWSAEQAWGADNLFSITESGNYTDKVQVRVYTVAGLYTDSTLFSVKLDKNAPVNAKITANDNIFTSFLNTITFGLFFKDSVNVAITAEDDISGIKSIEYQKVDNESAFDPNGTWTNGDSFTVAPDGKFIIYAKITDNAGNTTVINSNGMITENTKPVLTLSYPSDWQTSNVNVEVNVEDALSGLGEVTYSTDEEVPQTGTVSLYDGKGVITLSHEGSYNLTVIVKDKSGNVNTQTVAVKLDKTTPTAAVITNADNYTAGKWYNTSQTISAAFTPTMGSSEKLQYSLDGGNTWTDGSYVQVIAEGVNTVMFRVLDELGNAGETQSVVVQIDKTAPAKPKADALDTTSTKVTGTAEPGTVVTVKNAAGTLLGTAITGADGTYSIVISAQAINTVLYVNAADSAGNSSITELTVQSVTSHVSEMIDALPEPDTALDSEIVKAQEDILNTKQAYDALDDAERALINITRKQKLNKLLVRLNSILIIESKDSGSGIAADQLGTSVLIPELNDSNVGKVKILLNVSPVATGTSTENSNIGTASFRLQGSGQSILAAYDISLLKSVYGLSGTLYSQTKVNNSDIVDYITIRIPIPEGYENRADLSVVYIDDSGNVTPFTTSIVTIDGVKYLEFQTNHFSEYAIVANTANTANTASSTVTSATSTASSVSQPNTGDTSPIGIMLILLIVSGTALILLKEKRKKRI